MQEGDLRVVGAGDGRVVQHGKARFLGLGDISGDVIGLESDVVDAFPFFLNSLGDSAFRRGGFEQFDVDAGNVKHGDADLLSGDFLNVGLAEPERIAVIGNGGVKTLDGDADMVNLLNHMRVMVIGNAGGRPAIHQELLKRIFLGCEAKSGKMANSWPPLSPA